MSDREASSAGRRKWNLVQRLAMDPRLNQSAVCVGLRLLDYMDKDTGVAWPSNRTLAKDVKVSERTIQEALALLRRHGYIETRPRGRGWQHRIVFDPGPLPGGLRSGPRTPGSVSQSRKRASENTPDLGSGLPASHAPDVPRGPPPVYGATTEAGFRDFNTGNLRRGTGSRKNGAAISEERRTDLGSDLPTNHKNQFEPARARVGERVAGPPPRERSPPGKGAEGELPPLPPEEHPLVKTLQKRIRETGKTG